jgi:2',3'-cyclic-nucleotide 2'-phosphodiesterase (5'-nucleotidase family)
LNPNDALLPVYEPLILNMQPPVLLCLPASVYPSRIRRFCFSLLALILLAGVGCKGSKTIIDLPPAVAEAPTEMIFLQINDVYEIGPLEGGKIGGMARVATLRQELLAENPHTFTVLSGDFLSPSVIGTAKIDGNRVAGAQMVDVMNAVGIDYVTFGNHEFDLKESDLQARIDESQFEWVSSNVLHKTKSGVEPFFRNEDGEKFPFPTHAVIYLRNTYDGRSLRVGIIAVTLPFTQQPYLEYFDVFSAAKEAYDEIRENCEFVVAITHLEMADDRRLAAALPGLALIMGGHEHENMLERVGNVPIAKADANAKSAYVHRILYDPKTGKTQVVSDLRILDDRVAQQPEIAGMVSEWEQRAYQVFKDQGFDLEAPVAVLKVPLDGLESHIRNEPTNLGQAIAQAMYDAAGDADVAILNSGSVRIDDYLSGEITQFDIIRTLPFGGAILKVDMKGEVLQQVLNAGLQNRGMGGYLQTSHVMQDAGGRWMVGEAPLDPQRIYRVAITDFLMTGGEANLGFLRTDHPGVIAVREPGTADILRDVRLVLVEYLKKL